MRGIEDLAGVHTYRVVHRLEIVSVGQFRRFEQARRMEAIGSKPER